MAHGMFTSTTLCRAGRGGHFSCRFTVMFHPFIFDTRSRRPLNIAMRYWELIIESDAGTAVAAANHRATVAASRYQAKLRTATDQAEAAQKLPAGTQRAERERAAQAKRVEAARVYQDTLRAANDTARKARQKAAKDTELAAKRTTVVDALIDTLPGCL